MKKIIVICPFPENEVPGQRLKYEQYFESWRKEGYEITVRPFVSTKFMKIIYKPSNFHLKFFYTFFGYLKRSFLLFELRKYDIVYSFLWITPFGPPIFEHLVSILSKKLIYDIDDLVFLKHSSNANRFFEFLKGKSKPIVLMKKANHVITCTPFLDEFVKKYNKNTTDISSTVDTENRYLPVNTYKNDHQIVFGWSGSHSTSKYLYLLKDVLISLSKEFDFKLIVMGDKSFQIAGVNIEALDWEESKEIETLQKFDIGLYPLPFEDWVLGKSGLKAIQYMALGIPTIATNVGTIDRIIVNNKNGILISNNDFDEWKNKMIEFILSESLRKQIGIEARKTIEKNYSIEANKNKYLNIINS